MINFKPAGTTLTPDSLAQLLVDQPQNRRVEIMVR
jgi:hypothetical protein